MPNLLDCSRIPFFLLLQAMVFCSAAAADTPRPSTSEGRPDYCGVWGIWGGERVSTEGRPWFKGVVVTSEWNRIEPRPGEFSWDALDRKVRDVVDKGLTVMIMIYHGLMFKGPNPQSNDWLMEHLPDSWRKPHMIAQGYQFNHELRVMDELYPRTRRRIDGVLIRTRGELDNTTRPGENWFNAAPVWNVYWAGLWNLTYWIDIWNQLVTALEDERFVTAFEFVSRYAGYKTPAESPGAWIALRDGLDCADTRRFPEDRFGPIGAVKPWQASQNLDRYQRIAEAFAQFGAANDDLKNVGANGLDMRRQRGLNDVGYRVWSDNYGMFLNQHDPEGTSRGYWRVGSKSEPYGRFARGFCHAEGKNAMFFRIEHGFFAHDMVPGNRKVAVRVVYFDRGRGQWALRYDGGETTPKTALVVTNSDSGQWKQALATIDDGHFAGGCPHQTDLMLVNLDEEDNVFHMIELVRKTRAGSGLFSG